PSLDHLFYNVRPIGEIHPLSLHDALPISGAGARNAGHGGIGPRRGSRRAQRARRFVRLRRQGDVGRSQRAIPSACRIFTSLDIRSEEHTSELQSREKLVCRLLLEKKKTSI